MDNQYGQSKLGSTYFAADNTEKLVSACIEKTRSFYNVLDANFYLDKLARQWQFYHGEYGSDTGSGSHAVGFSGEEGELVTMPINHYRNIAQHMLVMITANRPSMQARAVNTDYKSLSQTYLANSILDYYMREKKLEDVIRRSTEMAIVLGAGFVRMEWNATAGEMYDFDADTGEKNFEGEIEFTVHSPFDVVFDGTKDTWDNEWVIIRSRENKYNLMAKYPEMAEKIRNIPVEVGQTYRRTMAFSNDNTDDIFVYEFFHKRTEAVPEGRYCMYLAADVTLIDIPLPYRQIPVFRITAGEFIGTPYGYTPMFDVFPIQEGINSLYSTIMTNQSAFGVQNLFVPRGADLDINSLEGAMNIIEGNAKPEPLNLTNTPKEVFDFLQMLIGSAETISGVNSVARGDPQASLKSGTALALVQSMALQFISGLQNNYVKLIEDTGTALINILKDFAKTPKTVALVGKNNRPLLKEFTSDDIDSINRVIVDIGNPLSKTTAGRVQMAQELLQMGLIKNPDQYFQVLNTGSIDSMYESDMNTLLLIKDENERLMQGEAVLADMLDEHSEHILEHRGVLANPDLRRNPELRKLVQDHIQEHIDFLRTVDPDLLMLIKQQPLQNPQAPQTPPNMPPINQPGGNNGGGGSVGPTLQAQTGLPMPGEPVNGVPLPEIPQPPVIP